MTHYVLARELRGDRPAPVTAPGNNNGPYNNRFNLAPRQQSELVHVPSMGSFAVARSLSSQLRLDHFELRNLDDGDSFFDQRGPSPAPSIVSSGTSSHEHEERGISDRGTGTPDKESSEKYFDEKAGGSEVGEQDDAPAQDGVLHGYRLFFVFLSLLLCTFVGSYSCRWLI